MATISRGGGSSTSVASSVPYKSPGDPFTAQELELIITTINTNQPSGGGTDNQNLALGTASNTTLPLNISGGTGVTLPVATATAGLMSGTDKAKLDLYPALPNTLDATKLPLAGGTMTGRAAFSGTNTAQGTAVYSTATDTIAVSANNNEVVRFPEIGIVHSKQLAAGVVNTDNTGLELPPFPIADSNFTVAQRNYVNTPGNWGTNATITEITLGFKAGQYYLNTSTKTEYTVYQADNVARKVIGGAKAYESMQKMSWAVATSGGSLIANNGVFTATNSLTFTLPSGEINDVCDLIVASGVTGTSVTGSTVNVGLNKYLLTLGTNTYTKIL